MRSRRLIGPRSQHEGFGGAAAPEGRDLPPPRGWCATRGRADPVADPTRGPPTSIPGLNLSYS